MEFFLANDNIDKQIKDIKQKILMSMNGVVSELMEQKGIIYKKNYGVSVPVILQIAGFYKPNHQLASRLWEMKIRETMMLGLLLEQVEYFTFELAIRRIKEINQLDLAEFSSLHVFCKMPFTEELCLNCVFSEILWEQIIGFMIATRIIDRLKENEIEQIIQEALILSEKNEFQLSKSISGFLSRLCRVNKNTAQYVIKKTEMFKSSALTGQKYIYEMIEQEIAFLDYI